MIASWSPKQVAEWLMRSGFAEYAQTFEDNEISGDVLPTITNEVLRDDLKIHVYGHRVKLVNAIQKLLEACGTIPQGATNDSRDASPETSPHDSHEHTSLLLPQVLPVEALHSSEHDLRPIPDIPKRNLRTFYNTDAGRALRLDPTRAHMLIQDTSGKRSHCVMCFSISSTSQRRREMNTKWQCAVCRAHLCRHKFGKEKTSCFDKFHSLAFLEQVQRPRPRPRQYFILPDWDPNVDSLEKLRQRAAEYKSHEEDEHDNEDDTDHQVDA
ncbi:hypothetical protein THRCLA_20917 [Thraustotheca clavata]|uniref:SAM domain-containing protein n=1 Tax=Thraustotheca clavata TaxID=74557 RepID=A0A1W0A201_9STRA|nr:hypothetical protein THRCLA_20917 [Thraustotheca clavata]